MGKKPAIRKCVICKTPFEKRRSFEKWCSPECGYQVAKKKLEEKKRKEVRADTKKRREALEPLSYFADKAQKAINAYVRFRDRNDGCISCNKQSHWDGQWHASHFRSRGAASSIRFNLWNLHKSCSECNHMKSGNIGEYYPRLLKKIGQEKVDWLYQQNEIKRYTREYLQRLESIFKRKLAMRKKRASAQEFS